MITNFKYTDDVWGDVDCAAHARCGEVFDAAYAVVAEVMSEVHEQMFTKAVFGRADAVDLCAVPVVELDFGRVLSWFANEQMTPLQLYLLSKVVSPEMTVLEVGRLFGVSIVAFSKLPCRRLVSVDSIGLDGGWTYSFPLELLRHAAVYRHFYDRVMCGGRYINAVSHRVADSLTRTGWEVLLIDDWFDWSKVEGVDVVVDNVPLGREHLAKFVQLVASGRVRWVVLGEYTSRQSVAEQLVRTVVNTGLAVAAPRCPLTTLIAVCAPGDVPPGWALIDLNGFTPRQDVLYVPFGHGYFLEREEKEALNRFVKGC